MLKTEFPGVQHLSGKSFRVLAAVNFVAENGMTKMMKMYANLVSPAAVQFAFNQTEFVRRAQDSIFRFRGAPASFLDRHPLPMNRMPSNFFFNDARDLAQLSGDEREINLFRRARGELFR